MKVEGETEAKSRWKENSKKAASVTLTWVVYSGILTALFTATAVGSVPLGPRFNPSVLTAWLIAIAVVSLATAWGCRRTEKNSPKSDRWTLTQKQKTILGRAVIGAGLLVIVAAVSVPFIVIEIKEDHNAWKSEKARRNFAVTSHLGNGPEFEVEAFDQTLAELHDSFQELKDNWTVQPEADRIRVWLFRDLQDYRIRTGQETASGHAWCTEEFGPVIAIPLEDAPSTSNNDTFSRTPMHEVVHALMCQSLGAEAFRSIPSWFHEGLATKYQMDGFRRTVQRIITRSVTWWKRDQFLKPESFCNVHASELSEKRQVILYATALEFTKFLQSTHGIETLNMIVDDVRTGTGFGESLESRLGGTCQALYNQWQESF